MMPSKSQLMTVGLTLAVLWAVMNIDALDPVRKFVNIDRA